MWRIASLLAALAVAIPAAVFAQYRDAEAFDAHGRVHSLIVESQRELIHNRYYYAFSNDGQLTKTADGPVIQIDRDAQGRLIRYVYNDAGSYYGFEYDGQGRVCNSSFPGGEAIFTRDAEGRIVSNRERFMGSNDLYEYTYLAFDDHGNWTQRSITRNGSDYATETRRILYMSDSDPAGDAKSREKDDNRPVALVGTPFPDAETSRIDEYYRDLLQYDIQGLQHTYRVIIGQTTMEELAGLKDVIFDEIIRNEGRVTRIELDGGNVVFHADNAGERVANITYEPASIPAIWKTRYGIDRNTPADPNRREILRAAGLEWVASGEASLWTSPYEAYAVKSNGKIEVDLTMSLRGDALSLIQVELREDESGLYPHLAATSSDGTPGGFLQKSFGRIKREKQERDTSLKTTTTAAKLTPWTIINRPFGILPGQVSRLMARLALARRTGWNPESVGSARIRITPEDGYDLDFMGLIPEASATFSEPAEGDRVRSFDFCFRFTSNSPLPREAAAAILRINAQRTALRIISSLQLLGIVFDETTDGGDIVWLHKDSYRSVEMRISPAVPVQEKPSCELRITVQLPTATGR